MKLLITGAAGFIGFHTVLKFINTDTAIIGIDNINAYYDQNLKLARLKESGIQPDDIQYGKPVQSKKHPNYTFVKADITDKNTLNSLFEKYRFDYVCHLAAQAGVRYSLENPNSYIESNLSGFSNILEACRHFSIKHLVFASSSSVYGLNETMPFSPKDSTEHPVSLYAATKKANEMMAHSYSHLFKIPVTGLRFFTVYGPWGRPDMALFIFTKAISENKSIKVNNMGNMKRDFTYIGDITEGLHRIIQTIPGQAQNWNAHTPNPAISSAPYRIYNIGNSQPVKLMNFINIIEQFLNKKAKKEYMPMQKGDVAETFADISELTKAINYKPKTDIEAGVKEFIRWYKSYYKL
jgi:UDP-glucuronate 4-epimerase